MSQELIEYKGVTIRKYRYTMLPCTVRACDYEADVNGIRLTAKTRKEINTLVNKALKNMVMNTEEVKAVLKKHQEWCGEGMSQEDKRANLRGFYMRDVKIPNADLRYAVLQKSSLQNADLSGSNLSYADLRGADLSYADLRGADFTGADLTGACLSEAVIENTVFNNADLSKIEISAVKIRNSYFKKARFCEGRIYYSDIEKSVFDDSSMNKMYLLGSIRDSSFINADMTGANLHIEAANTDFSNADFTESDIRFSEFTDCISAPAVR